MCGLVGKILAREIFKFSLQIYRLFADERKSDKSETLHGKEWKFEWNMYPKLYVRCEYFICVFRKQDFVQFKLEHIGRFNNVTSAARRLQQKNTDSSRRYHPSKCTICVFVPLSRGFLIFASKYHDAPRSVFDAIRAKVYRRGRRCSLENWKAAGGGVWSSILHFPISSFSLSPEILLFRSSPVYAAALKLLQNRRSYRSEMGFSFSRGRSYSPFVCILEMFVRT